MPTPKLEEALKHFGSILQQGMCHCDSLKAQQISTLMISSLSQYVQTIRTTCGPLGLVQ